MVEKTSRASHGKQQQVVDGNIVVIIYYDGWHICHIKNMKKEKKGKLDASQ